MTRVYRGDRRRIHTEHEDLLSGLMRFDNDTIGVLDINWLTPTKIRELLVTGERGLFQVNYLTQDLTFYENSTVPADWDTLRTITGVSEGAMIRPPSRRSSHCGSSWSACRRRQGPARRLGAGAMAWRP